MIYGTGIDTIKVSRIENLLEKKYSLLRIYTENELNYINSKRAPAKFQTAAGIFCAKEAFVKSTGGGLREHLLSDIEVAKDNRGKPYFILSSKTGSFASENRLRDRKSVV